MALNSQTRLALEAALCSPSAYTEVKNILEDLEGGAMAASFTVGTEGSEKIRTNIQVNDDAGNAIASRQVVKVLLFDDANGDAFNTDNYTVAAGTDGAVAEVLADKVLVCVTEVDGDLDIDLTISGAATSYLAVVLPSGKMAISGAITHA